MRKHLPGEAVHFAGLVPPCLQPGPAVEACCHYYPAAAQPAGSRPGQHAPWYLFSNSLGYRWPVSLRFLTRQQPNFVTEAHGNSMTALQRRLPFGGPGTALLLVDLERDFCDAQGASLPVPGAWRLLGAVNKLAQSAAAAGKRIEPLLFVPGRRGLQLRSCLYVLCHHQCPLGK